MKLSQIDPNPFRDGSAGDPPATWESVQKEYPFHENKIERLMASMLNTKVWENIIVRPHPDKSKRYQLAYGHHRIEALRRLVQSGQLADKLGVIVDSLSDGELLTMMANENAVEYGSNFLLSVVNPIEAVVKAYSVGKIKLRKVELGFSGVRPNQVRYAPHFLLGDTGDTTLPAYNAQSLAERLGWTESDGQPQARVKVALSALELIERGLLSRSTLDVGIEAAAKEVAAAKAAYEAALVRQEQDRARLEKVAKSDNINKAREAEQALKRFTPERVVANAQRTAQAAAKDVHRLVKSGVSVKEAAAAVETKHEIRLKPEKSKAGIRDFDSLTAKLDGVLSTRDDTWKLMMDYVKEAESLKAPKELLKSLTNLVKRAEARAEELTKQLAKREEK